MITQDTLTAGTWQVFAVPFGADLAVAPEDHGNAPAVFGEPLAVDYNGDGFEPLRGGGRKKACLPSC